MEKPYQDYERHVEYLTTPAGLLENVRVLKPLGHFIKADEKAWRPLFYPGYTLITPTFPNETANISTYCVLCDIQQNLLRVLNPTKVIPAPVSAFHATVARLISGTDFENRMKNGKNSEFITEITRVLSDIPKLKPVRMEVTGLSLSYNGVIMALLSPKTEDEYQRLIAVRNGIYQNNVLQSLGVEPKRLFLGHVTLAYIEDIFDWEEQNTLMELMTKINAQFFKEPLPFVISRAEVRRFDNYLRFTREDDWPVYQFV